jgi:hypothetical protein
MRLAISRAIPPGTLLRVDLKDSILLGEVSHGFSLGSEIHVGVQIKHVLTNLQQLRNLRESLMGQAGVPRNSACVR